MGYIGSDSKYINMKFWQKISFWNKVQLTVQSVLTLTQLSLIFGNAQHIFNVCVTAGQLIGLIIPIWMEDKDSNGTVDLFEKEITTTITSDSPITIKTETENK